MDTTVIEPGAALEEHAISELAPAEAGQESDARGDGSNMSLASFIEQFGDGLLEQVRCQNPPIYDPQVDRLQSIWQRLTPAEMREQATAVLEVPLAIEPLRPLH